jgi:hypothetical protein
LNKLEHRARRAAESILGNERLTAGLDDKAADELLDWGLARAEAVVHQTGGMNEDEAEGFISSQLRVVRGMMNDVRKWVIKGPEMDPAARQEKLAQLLEQAAAAYPDQAPPAPQQRRAFLQQQTEADAEPAQWVKALRRLVEESVPTKTEPNPNDEPRPADTVLLPPPGHPKNTTRTNAEENRDQKI